MEFPGVPSAWGSSDRLGNLGSLGFLRVPLGFWEGLWFLRVPWSSKRFLGVTWEAKGSLWRLGVPWGGLGFFRAPLEDLGFLWEAWGFLGFFGET